MSNKIDFQCLKNRVLREILEEISHEDNNTISDQNSPQAWNNWSNWVNWTNWNNWNNWGNWGNWRNY